MRQIEQLYAIFNRFCQVGMNRASNSQLKYLLELMSVRVFNAPKNKQSIKSLQSGVVNLFKDMNGFDENLFDLRFCVEEGAYSKTICEHLIAFYCNNGMEAASNLKKHCLEYGVFLPMSPSRRNEYDISAFMRAVADSMLALLPSLAAESPLRACATPLQGLTYISDVVELENKSSAYLDRLLKKAWKSSPSRFFGMRRHYKGSPIDKVRTLRHRALSSDSSAAVCERLGIPVSPGGAYHRAGANR